MIKKVLCLHLLALVTYTHAQEIATTDDPLQKTWAVVGAGPAGILTVGLLLDLGVPGNNITWIDPEFNAGRLGQYYTSIPGNAKTQMYIDFIQGCKIFQECSSQSLNALYTYDREKAYPLHIIVEPLQDITNYLSSKVTVVKNTLISLYFENNLWNVGIQGDTIQAYSVVLATGSHPRTLNYDCNHKIPLDIALNKSLLAEHVQATDSIAVIGSSHSAVLLLKFLHELKVQRIINFYKKPLVYSVDMGSWIFHAEGLKASTAEWAKNVLEKNPPISIIRIFNTQQALDAWLPTCNKIIYAVGFERNELPLINGMQEITYDDRSGVIAERLFGIGIAFPENYIDPLGNNEHRIGLKFFLEYAQRVMPEWIKRNTYYRFMSFDQLFMIDAL